MGSRRGTSLLSAIGNRKKELCQTDAPGSFFCAAKSDKKMNKEMNRDKI